MRPGANPRASADQSFGQQSLRGQNLSLVLRYVVDAVQPPSRAEVAAATGLTRATVSTLVESLLDARLISEQKPSVPQRAGRPAVPLVPASGTVAAIGAEVSADYVGVRALDLSGWVLAETVERGDFRAADPELVLRRVRALVQETLAAIGSSQVRLAGGGLALPGLIDSASGTLRIAPNLGWRDVDVARHLGAAPRQLPYPLELGNEADFAARAEARARRSRGPTSFVYVSGDVGVGSAIVLDGALLRGRHGWSGEIGHTALGTTGSFRAGGTLEAYAGKDAIVRAARLPLSTSAAELVAHANAGTPRVAAALARAGDALGVALANVANLVDVQDVVLGGMYAGLGPHLQGPVTAQLRHRLISAPWAPPAVHMAAADAYPAMTGGALAALDSVIADPAGWTERQDVSRAGVSGVH